MSTQEQIGSSRKQPAESIGALGRVLEKHYGPILAGMVILLTMFAWSRRFILDDAFISFRYARNLVDGIGLVWNPGEAVEGYTNFFWTMLMSLPMTLGMDPVAFCLALGPLLYAGTLFFCSLAAREVLGSRPLALITVALLGSNPTFVAFATGGLETQFLACVQTAMLWLILNPLRGVSSETGRALTISVLAAIALMTRLDSAIVVGISFLYFGVMAWQSSPVRSHRTALLVALWVPLDFLVGLWLVWKIMYYGAVLPNTFYSKTSQLDAWTRGLDYLRIFVTSYLLFPCVIFMVLGIRRVLSKGSRKAGVMMLALAAHCGYLASVGDFMEFRMLVPVLPILFVLIVWTVFSYLKQPILQALLIGLILVGAVRHARYFEFTHGIEPIEMLAAHLDERGSDWIGVGQALGEAFHGSPDVSIAVSAAGAIPYYSGLKTLDMLGLSDPWIARNGIEITAQPGHSRVAPLSYLIEQRINLILGHPWVHTGSTAERTHYFLDELGGFVYLIDDNPDVIPSNAFVIEIPLDEQRVVNAFYLTPHSAIESALSSRGWRKFPLASRAGGPR